MVEVEEEQELNIGELTYIDIRSQNKLIYGYYNNWIILQVSYPNKHLFLYKDKIIINRNCHPFPKETVE